MIHLPKLLLISGLVALAAVILNALTMGLTGLAIGDYLSAAEGIASFGSLFALLGIFSILRPATRYMDRLLSHEVIFRRIAQAQQNLLDQLIPKAYQLERHFRQDDLSRQLSHDIEKQYSTWMSVVIPSLNLGLMLACLMVVTLWIGSSEFATFLGLLVVILVLSFIWMRYRYRVLFTERHHLQQVASDASRQQLKFISWSLPRQTSAEWTQAVTAPLQTLQDNELRIREHDQTSMLIIQTLWSLGLLCILMLGTLNIQTLPVLMLTLFLWFSLSENMMALPFIAYSEADAKQARNNLASPDINDPTPGSHDLTEGVQDISLNNLVISNKASQPLTLSIKHGQCIGITGASGIGKSSLFRFLQHQARPSAGDILLNGKSVTEYSHSAIATAFCEAQQTPFILDGTLEANIRLVAPQATTESINSLLDALELKPGGTAGSARRELILGAGGIQLSSGEKRRLELSRVLLSEASVLLLDEPTEGLDPATEALVIKAIQQYQKEKTLVMISHRQAPLELCEVTLQLR